MKVAGHDTATALRADPAASPGRCFVSLGSWAVVGVVVDPARQASAPFRTLAPVMHEATADGALRVNRNVPALQLVQQLEREQLGLLATAVERTALLPPPSGWDPAPVVDVFTLDVHRSVAGQVEAWGRTAGRPTSDLAAVLRELLRGVAQAVARAVDDLAAAGLAERGRGIWVSGGGVRVPAMTAWVAELTGSAVEQGPVAASAVGGVLGTVSLMRSDGPGAAVTLDGMEERWTTKHEARGRGGGADHGRSEGGHRRPGERVGAGTCQRGWGVRRTACSPRRGRGWRSWRPRTSLSWTCATARWWRARARRRASTRSTR